MIQVKNLSLLCDGRSILQNATFNILKGQRILITGKSGIGKSLLAKSLLEQNPQVERTIDLHEIVYLPQHAEQSFNPLQKIKVHFEDIRNELKYSEKNFYEIVTEYFVSLSLSLSCLDLYPFECSGGMLQRLQIILALCQKPKCIIADEPTTALNNECIYEVLELWKRESDQGVAFVIVTHQVKFYESFAYQIYELKNRKLQRYEVSKMRQLVKKGEKTKTFLCCKIDGQILRASKGFWRSNLTPVLIVKHFTCYQGEVIGIRGKSGSGKTTLLNAMRTSDSIKGEVKLPTIQYVPQLYDESFPTNWQVKKIIKEAQQAANCSKEDCIQLLEKLQLQPSIVKQRIQTLSGGQRQKLALFRVLLKKPQLLLLDESFSSLDDESTEQLTEILIQFVQDGLSIICVSHDEDWLNNYADRQYIVENDEVREVVNEEILVKPTAFIRNASSV